MQDSVEADRQRFLSMFDSCVVGPMIQVIDFPDNWDLTEEDLSYVAGRLKQLAYRFEQLARHGRGNN